MHVLCALGTGKKDFRFRDGCITPTWEIPENWADMTPRMPIIAFATILFSAIAAARYAAACDDTSVRQATFQAERELHRLCLMADTTDPAADSESARLTAWLVGEAAGLNVAFERVDAHDPGVVWSDYGLPSAPPALPVAVLIGRDNVLRRHFVIDHWEPGPSAAALGLLRTSPVREAIQRDVGNYWAVLLYTPGAGPDGGAAETVLDAVVRRWAQEQPPGVAVVRLDRTDTRERLLVSFIGLDQAGPDWVGVVFGRGKLMAPPLVGREITEANVNELVERLVAPCTCLQNPSTLGVDIPMIWTKALDAAVVPLAGSGYHESVLGNPTKSLEPAVQPRDNRVVTAALLATGAAMLVAVGATASVVWRWRRRTAP